MLRNSEISAFSSSHGLDVHGDDAGAFHIQKIHRYPVVQLQRVRRVRIENIVQQPEALRAVQRSGHDAEALEIIENVDLVRLDTEGQIFGLVRCLWQADFGASRCDPRADCQNLRPKAGR